MPRPKDINTRYREIERGMSVTIIAPLAGKVRCDDCGKSGLCFSAHCFIEPNRPFRDLCKSCAIARAGSEEQVWLRTTSVGLPDIWRTGQRRYTSNRRSARAERRLAASSAEGD